MTDIKKVLTPVLAFLRRNRWYLIWLVALLLCIIFAGLDNPTGIVLGWLAVAILFLVLFRKWRKPRNFLYLLLATFFGAIILSAIDVEVARRLAEWIGGPNATDSAAWRAFHAVISNIILLVTPVGITFGFFGFIVFSLISLVSLIKNKRTERGT
jgi:hypothetical protein